MMSCDDISLREVFDRYIDTDQVVCVQNIPAKASKDTVVFFIEVVLKTDAIAVCKPLPDTTKCCLFVMEDKVTDFRTYEKTLQERKLEGNTVIISPLGQVEGLFLRDVPEDLSDEFLSLYFESPKSCGEVGCVDDVKSCGCCRLRMVIIVMADADVVRRIINKQVHPNLDKYCVHVEPYFPIIHDEVFNTHGRDKSVAQDTASVKPTDDKAFEKEQAGSKRVINKKVLPESPQQLTNPLTTDDCVTEMIAKTDRLKIAETPMHKLTKESSTYTISGESSFPKERQHISHEIHSYKRSPSKLRIFCDDADVVGPLEIVTGNKSERPFQSRHSVDLSSSHRDENSIRPAVSRHPGDPTETLIPVDLVSNISNTQENNDDGMNKVKIKNSRKSFQTLQEAPLSDSRREHSDNKISEISLPRKVVPQNTTFTEQLNNQPEELVTIDVAKTDIVLLKINGFTKAKGNCKVTLMEKQCRVQFDGDTELVRQTQIKMYETLQHVEEAIKTFPRHHIKCISENLGYLRTQMIKRKIGAVLKIDADQTTMHSLAFSVQQAEKGIEFVTDALISKLVTIRADQTGCFASTKWESVLQSLPKHVQVTVCNEDHKVDIVAFNEVGVNSTRHKIIQFLKESQPKSKTEVKLKGASARCFKYYFLEDLKQIILRQNGEISCRDEGSEALKLVVEGGQSLSKLVTDKVKLVWHEKVDFRKITTDENELWLLMKGLASQNAKDFLDKFERENMCFVDVDKDGQVFLPTVSVQRIETGSEEIPSKIAAERETGTGFSREQDQARNRFSLDIAKEFQHGLSDDMALQMALAESLSEPVLHANTQELPRSFTTGSLRPYDVTNDIEEEVIAYSDLPTFHSAEQMVPITQQQKMYSRRIGNVTVTIKQGAIATETISGYGPVAKVNVISPSQDLEKESVISKAFVTAGGKQLVQDYTSVKHQFSLGVSVVVTPGRGTLNCDYVYHAILKKTTKPEMIIAPLMKECFRLCSTNFCSRIAFPPLGVGRLYQYPASKVAECMMNEIRMQGQIHLQEIVVIIFDKDKETYGVFEAALNSATSWIPNRDLYGDQAIALRCASQDQRDGNADYGKRLNPFTPRRYHYNQIPPRPAGQSRVSRATSLFPVQQPWLAGANIEPILQPPNHASQPIDKLRPPNPSVPIYQNTRLPKPSAFKPVKMTSMARTDPDMVESGSKVQAFSRRKQEEHLRRSKKPKERPPPEEPAVKYAIKVFSKDKTSCEKARKELGIQLKVHFLYEMPLERKGKLSPECKKKIRDVLRKWNVKSFKHPVTKDFIIKGWEKVVSQAYGEVLKIILEFKEKETSSETKKTRRRDLRSKPNEFVKHMALEHDPEIPTYWKNFNSGSPISIALTAFKTLAKDFVTVRLGSNDPVFAAIINLITTTWDGSKVGQGKDARGLNTLNYTNIRVKKIHRVENLQLFEKYVHRRKHIFLKTHRRQRSSCTPISRLPGSNGKALTEEFQRCSVFEDELCSEVNEHFFFHGTTSDAVDVICDSGLDSRLGSHQAMYGAGIYGAESSTKADQYADAKDKRTREGKKMFLIRMVLGDSYLCTDTNPHKYRRPPCTNTNCLRDDCKDKTHGSFDSITGQSGRLFREFVVYQAEQCYPEYIISYDRV